MKSLILIFAFFSASAFAQPSDWATVSQSKEKDYQVKISSLAINKQNNPQAIIRTRTIAKNSFVFHLVSITKMDCDNGFGNLFFYDTSHKLQFTVEFVKNGGTHAANIADLLCIFEKPMNSV
jgi:hypothetical protein